MEMMRIFRKSLLTAVLFAAFGGVPAAEACTTAVVSARASADGRPFLWKQRDTGAEWNHIQHFKGCRYDFTGLVNSEDSVIREVWVGANTAGFAVMNSASYNMKPDSLKRLPELEGVVMMQALGECATVDDFERLIRALPMPRCVETNFGVIDAAGGAAYFEVWDYGYVKYDANDPSVAADGYLIRSNFSLSGRADNRLGYERYLQAQRLFARAYDKGRLTPAWIYEEPSRSFCNIVLGTDLRSGRDRPRTGWAVDQDYIPRNSTSASVVVGGVNAGGNPDAVTMWCLLGYPPCSYPVAVWVKSGSRTARCLQPVEAGKAPLNRMAVQGKRRVFPVTEGNGNRYLRFDEAMFYMRKQRSPMKRSQREGERVARRIASEGFDPAWVEDYNRFSDSLFLKTASRMAIRR